MLSAFLSIKNAYSLAVSGSIKRFHAYTKSFAVNAVPSDHLASSLIWKVYSNPSSLTSQLSAKSGSATFFSFNCVNPASHIVNATKDVPSVAVDEFMLRISVSVAIVTELPEAVLDPAAEPAPPLEEQPTSIASAMVLTNNFFFITFSLLCI